MVSGLITICGWSLGGLENAEWSELECTCCCLWTILTFVAMPYVYFHDKLTNISMNWMQQQELIKMSIILNGKENNFNSLMWAKLGCIQIWKYNLKSEISIVIWSKLQGEGGGCSVAWLYFNQWKKWCLWGGGGGGDPIYIIGADHRLTWLIVMYASLCPKPPSLASIKAATSINPWQNVNKLPVTIYGLNCCEGEWIYKNLHYIFTEQEIEICTSWKEHDSPVIFLLGNYQMMSRSWIWWNIESMRHLNINFSTLILGLPVITMILVAKMNETVVCTVCFTISIWILDVISHMEYYGVWLMFVMLDICL